MGLNTLKNQIDSQMLKLVEEQARQIDILKKIAIHF